MQQSREDRSLGELFSELSRDTSTLIRQEIALAKTEMSEKASTVGKNVGFLAVGGAVAYAGFLVLLGALVVILALFLPWWLSALIVGFVVAAIGYTLVQKGISTLKQVDMAPRETIESLKEDKEWAKKQVS
jgi:xanthine/uracil permease